MNRIAHFEIPVTNPRISLQFYTSVFGWKFQEWEGLEDYWILLTDTGEPRICGRLMRREDPAQPMACAVEVEDIDAICAAIETVGGKVVVSKIPIQGIGWLAYFSDPEGLVGSVVQRDASVG